MTRDEITAALAAPFEADVVDFKPQSVKNNRALAVAYIDARVVMNRLDAVLGVGNWQTTSREVGDSVVCRLRVRIDGEWTEHEDVGSPSEQPDAGDRLKAAYSDALKRVAVRVGVGRYLYDLPHAWCDYDQQKRQFAQKPTLPAWALPKRAAPAPARKEVQADAGRGNETAATPSHDYQRLLLEIDERLRARKKGGWKAALQYVGQAIGESFEEPDSDDAVRAFADWLPRDVAERIRKALMQPAKA